MAHLEGKHPNGQIILGNQQIAREKEVRGYLGLASQVQQGGMERAFIDVEHLTRLGEIEEARDEESSPDRWRVNELYQETLHEWIEAIERWETEVGLRRNGQRDWTARLNRRQQDLAVPVAVDPEQIEEAQALIKNLYVRSCFQDVEGCHQARQELSQCD